MRKYVIFLKRRIIITYLRNKPYPANRCIHRLNMPFVIKRREQKKLTSTSIFGVDVPLDRIDWQCDYKSGFKYPMIKSEKIKYHLLYNQGIDVIFPWELSRFYFAIDLAIRYVSTKDKHYYYQFKTMVTDWITRNPLLYGINWTSGMDVSIRASNWIVACNLFGRIFFHDHAFCLKVSVSLSNHLGYINHLLWYSTPNNHKVSHYCGLLLLALSFSSKRGKPRAIRKAISGIEACMSTQVFVDGTNFEHAIPYHRLVLEMFGFTTLIAQNNQLTFSAAYYQQLFKMFEFTAACIDRNGNAPQIGDNDSGHFLIWDPANEHDYRYLLSLGEAIFTHTFAWQPKNNDNRLSFSNKESIHLAAYHIIPQKQNDLLAFEEGGYYMLKNNLFHLVVFCPSCISGGHRHFDSGSFTLSYKGTPIIVDPGSYVYTGDLKTRCAFRDYYSHNLYVEKGYQNPADSYFGIKTDRTCRVIQHSQTELVFETELSKDTKIQRQFQLTPHALHINDAIESSKKVESYLHFYGSPITEEATGNYRLRSDLRLSLPDKHSGQITWGNYDYSPSYGVRMSYPLLCISAENKLLMSFIALHN